jgi:Ca-activated chloride channel family protein
VTFNHREFFILLLPIFVVLYGTSQVRLGLRTVRFPMGLRAIKWPESRFRFRRLLQILLRGGASVGLVAALAQPQSSKSTLNRAPSGVNTILALDSSAASLGNARTAAGRYIESRLNDRIGLIEFSTQASVLSPPTLDHKFLIQKVDGIQGSGLGGGGALGEVVAQSVKQLRDSTTPSRSLVLMVGSRGGSAAGSVPPDAAITLAQTYGIKVSVLYIEETSTAATASVLASVTSNTGGMYLQASSADVIEQGLSRILSNELVGSQGGASMLVHEEQFMLPVMLGLAALLLEFLMSKTWLRKWPN